MQQRIDRSGHVYNDWTVLHPADPYRRNGSAYWTCQCTCGSVADIQIKQVVKGSSRRCRNCRRFNRPDNVYIQWGERTMIQTDWARALGLLNATLAYRVLKGWPLTRALTEGVDPVILELLVPDRSTDPVRVSQAAEGAGEQ